MKKELSKSYNPKDFEDRIYESWEKDEDFTADVNAQGPTFTIAQPPPNVTGNLHMGHALNNALQDVVIRYKRMCGYNTLWIPGTDHASISTEAKVVEKLKKQGIEKRDIGREKFLEAAWDWTYEYGGNIKNQLKKLGISCDWSRERFTLDDGLSKAVNHVFVKLYNEGLIYQGDRIVNWCPSCETAISDAEVVHKDVDGNIWTISYPLKDEEGYLNIATTRPETMLGDLAVAVNPNDERYTHLIGKKLILPLVGRELEIIADEYVEKDFGTGCVKITPSHDPNDFEVGKRHNLSQLVVINNQGKIVDGYGEFSGLDRYEARKLILQRLEEQGLLVEVKKHNHSVGHCERCSTVIEPLLSKQWYVKMESLAEPALNAIENGELRILPKYMEKTYINWLKSIRDWCISRQLWWGHQIPVWKNKKTNELFVSEEEPKDVENYDRDPDTLDTWFSSALWPFSTLGWPEETPDFKKYFPTQACITGYDILFFWVIRMVFSSIHHTGKLPFTDVYLTGLIRDEFGRKMSKSLGNGIDPLEIIDKYGADALRFAIINGTAPGSDQRFKEEKVIAYRNFANKVWNATRFILMNLSDDVDDNICNIDLSIQDKWLLAKINNTAKEIGENLDKYEIGNAAASVYSFIWDDLCDRYLEFSKSRLKSSDDKERKSCETVLLYALKSALKFLHPFMPFITEEIWSYLPATDGKIIHSEFPRYENSLYVEEEKTIDLVSTAITAIRNEKATRNIALSKKAEIIFEISDKKLFEDILEIKYLFENMVGAEPANIVSEVKDINNCVSIVLDRMNIYIKLDKLVDYAEMLCKLKKDLDDALKNLQMANSKLSNEKFMSKAPKAVVDKEIEKRDSYQTLVESLKSQIEDTEKYVSER